MKNFKKFLALFITITVAFAAFGSVFVYADENDVPVNIGFEIANKSVNCGDSFPINVRFDFDSAIEASGGIIVFRYILKYDADVLDIVDPNTMQPLEIGEDGYPTEGSFFIFGNIGEESSLTVLKAGEGQLRLVYGGRSALSDIMTSGPIAQFAFKVKSDLQLNESLYTSFEIVNPEISLTDKNYKAVIETEKLDVKIMSQFTIPSFGSQKQNTTLNISGRSSIGTDGTEPLMAKIVQGENVIEEKQSDVTVTRFNVSFELA